MELELTAGPAGWVTATLFHEGEFWDVYVRLRPATGGTWEPQGTLYTQGLRPGTLREIPLRRILAAVEASDDLRSDLQKRLGEQAPEPGTREFTNKMDTGWPRPEPPVLELKRPSGRKLPDSFYADVAETYRTAITRGLNPRTAIANAAETSTEVAGRWVAEARKRGNLPPTTPGKARA